MALRARSRSGSTNTTEEKREALYLSYRTKYACFILFLSRRSYHHPCSHACRSTGDHAERIREGRDLLRMHGLRMFQGVDGPHVLLLLLGLRVPPLPHRQTQDKTMHHLSMLLIAPMHQCTEGAPHQCILLVGYLHRFIVMSNNNEVLVLSRKKIDWLPARFIKWSSLSDQSPPDERTLHSLDCSESVSQTRLFRSLAIGPFLSHTAQIP